MSTRRKCELQTLGRGAIYPRRRASTILRIFQQPAINPVSLKKGTDMDWLIITGAIISLIGLIGLFLCILRAIALRKTGDPDLIRERMQPLVALNFGAMALSMLGLMCVVIGVIL